MYTNSFHFLAGQRLRALVRSVAALLLFAGMGVAAQERNVLESIVATQPSATKLIVRATFRTPLGALPPGFSVTNPARIAIDLPNVANGIGRSTVDIAQGDVRTVSIVEAGARTRLVVNLTRPLNYTTTLEGNALLIDIDAIPQSALKESAQVTKFAAPTGVAPTQRFAIRDVDFRRGTNGEGRIIVDLNTASSGIDIRQMGKQVVIDFVGTSVPKNLVRRLDVIDFATPVRTVDVIEQGSNTRVAIEPQGNWEYSAYQTDTQFIVEIKPVRVDPNKLVQGTGYNGEKLSLNFQSIEVRAVLQVIADFTGLNIITSDTVGGNLTLRLKDVPWDQALDIILQAKRLAKRKNGNVVIIAPADELANQEKLALEVQQQTVELEPLRTESFVLSYAKAADVRSLLTDKDQKLLSKRGSATVDARTNTLFVQDVPTRLEDVRRLISQLDVPVRQVQIEARIVVADDRWGRQLGAKFNVAAGAFHNNRNIGVAANIDNAHRIAGGTSPAGADTPIAVNLPVAGAAGSLGVQILNLGNGNLLELELSALEADNRGKVVSNPRIVTADKQKALITQGTEIPYLTQASSGGTTISFKPAVLSLAVTPQITPDDKVIMDLDIKKDSVGQTVATSSGSVPSIDTKTLKTQIVVDNGDTAVLGGIFEQTTRTDIVKVPLLGDIPIIGHFFKRTSRQDDKTELLVFITPRIIKEQLTIR